MIGAGVITDRAFLARDAVTTARRLLGQRLVRVLPAGFALGAGRVLTTPARVAGTIVEVEAYVGARDRASHAWGGRRTARNEAMYAGPGRAYVYFTYGVHHCMNVVCARAGVPEAVLVRALEPTEGLEVMRALRVGGGARGGAEAGASAAGRAIADEALCRGPGNVCRALGIDRGLNGADLIQMGMAVVSADAAGKSAAAAGAVPEAVSGVGLVCVERAAGLRALPASRVGATARIGVGYAGEWAGAPLRFIVRGSASVSGPARLNAGAVSVDEVRLPE